MSSNPVHSESLPRWVFCAGFSCISSPGRCCVFRSMRFLQALIPLRHRPQTMKPSKKPQVHNATTYNNFRVSWRTALMPRARGQVVSIHPIAEKAYSRKPSPTGPTLYGEVSKGKSISHTPVEGKQIPQPHEYPHHCGRSHDGPGSSVHYVGNQKDYAAHPYRKQNRTRY